MATLQRYNGLENDPSLHEVDAGEIFADLP